MDADMQIRELAALIGVTPDTVINWELRGMRPWRRDVRRKLNVFVSYKIS